MIKSVVNDASIRWHMVRRAVPDKGTRNFTALLVEKMRELFNLQAFSRVAEEVAHPSPPSTRPPREHWSVEFG